MLYNCLNVDNSGAVERTPHNRDEADILQAPSTCGYINKSDFTYAYNQVLLLSYPLLQIYHLLTAHKPKDVWKFFDSIILQAEDLQVACSTMISTEGGCPLKPPVVTVGLAMLKCIAACGHCIMELSTFFTYGCALAQLYYLFTT